MWSETVPPIRSETAFQDRARDLEAAGLNGFAAVLVTLDPASSPTSNPAWAELEVHFHSGLHLPAILATLATTPAAEVFALSGGTRLVAGPGEGQVRVVSAAAGPDPGSLRLRVAPVGDYATYRLELIFDPARIDPVFSEIGFRFRPGCFSHGCAPGWTPAQPHRPAPVIDYLAKDYDSFRHLMITAMMERVPGWQPSSEADFDQVLIGLFAAAGDELSDFQDRVMAEARFGTARKRVSLERHARLMDYHIHQGQQSSTWAALTLREGTAPFRLQDELIAWAGGPDSESGTIPFATREASLPPGQRSWLAPGFNAFTLHDWAGAFPALAKGATGADILPAPTASAPAGLISAADLALAIRDGRLSRLLIAEALNPQTGQPPGRDPAKRQMLALLPEARVIRDPLAGRDVVRIRWRDEDALRADYAFSTRCPGGMVRGISTLSGNLLRLYQGMPVSVSFHEPGSLLPPETPGIYHRHFHRRSLYGSPRGLLCALPVGPLAWRATAPGGATPARSTLVVTVTEPGAAANEWDERPGLAFSDDSAEEGDHFTTETDERGASVLRFGNGVNGRLVPQGAVITARYQVGGGVAGNVGADTITSLIPLAAPHTAAISAIRNPFDVTDGLAPEPAAKILRNASEAWRARQLRAVTLRDYINRAEEVPGIARAVASYAWTGSWRTVRIVLDPVGRLDLPADLVRAVSDHLEAVRLIGEDLELRAPRFVAVDLTVSVCLKPEVWPGDLRDIIGQELSAGLTPDGRRGLFHPDNWTFGQSLHQSQIAGRLHQIPGIAHIQSISMRRRDAPQAGGDTGAIRLDAAFDEILLIGGDPDRVERGLVTLILTGGRQ